MLVAEAGRTPVVVERCAGSRRLGGSVSVVMVLARPSRCRGEDLHHDQLGGEVVSSVVVVEVESLDWVVVVVSRWKVALVVLEVVVDAIALVRRC